MSDEDEDSSSSTDEIDMLRPSQAAKKTALQNKLGTRPKVNQKNKGTPAKAVASRPAKPPPATKAVKPSNGKKDTSESDSDPISYSSKRSAGGKGKSQQTKEATKTKPGAKGKTGKQAVKKKPTADIEEITASETDNDKNATPVKPKPLGPSRYEPRPFPMDLSTSPVAGSSRATSSLSSVIQTKNKQFTSSKAEGLKRSRSPESSDSESDGPDFTYTQAVRLVEADPNTLCPFCDEPLPDPPSEILTNMLAKLKRKATPDPRYGNSLGLKLDMSQYISFCARHTAESEEFPKGQKYGWPTALDSAKLVKRIWKLQSQLQDIIDDPDEGTFLRPLQETASKYGKGAVTGAKGSWASFENASTGYYGEQGLALIMQVLFDMFPTIPGEKTAPLELSNYYSLVLVPEVALLLIQGDLQKRKGEDEGRATRSQALKVLRKSTKYGLAIFPMADGDKTNFGDDIARNRARKMRKLRDQEEEEERIRSSSQNTDAEVILELSTEEEEEMEEQKTPVAKKRRTHKPPAEEVVSAGKAAKRKTDGETVKVASEVSQPPIEKSVILTRDV
ncbi:hypothetical protein M408DRAFT_13122 [Serendipita vermifera MAFF 305830]|uniref:Restriction of telomere capping protein 4 n=1 Tax=Serendipita vermifera MAFF 305830 TaxID=933852 RepID=A0A0C2W126_SERVB|nr:hypothetical protein M408DRAFT_13122 [Serendipita vermifera MAFF 305830]